MLNNLSLKKWLRDRATLSNARQQDLRARSVEGDPAHGSFDRSEAPDERILPEPLSAARNVEELLRHEGDAFVECCYLTLLNRPSDRGGLETYRLLLGQGASKLEIAMGIASSPEGRLAERAQLVRGSVRTAFLSELLGRLLQAGQASDEDRSALVQSLAEIIVDEPPLPAAQPRLTVADQARASTPAAPEFPTNPAIYWVKQEASWHDSGPRKTKDSHQEVSRAPAEFWMDLSPLLDASGETRERKIIQHALAHCFGQTDCRFCVQAGNGFAEIQRSQLEPLLSELSLWDWSLAGFKHERTRASSGPVHVNVAGTDEFFHPFSSNAMVLAVSGASYCNPQAYALLKRRLPNLYLALLVLDPWPGLPETNHFYRKKERDSLEDHLQWISATCDLLLFGNKFAHERVQALQKERDWRSPPSALLKLGDQASDDVEPALAATELPEELLDLEPFILSAGPIASYSNHDVLYRAYLLALEATRGELPRWVICGPVLAGGADLAEIIDNDPRLKGRVLRLDSTEAQLAALYEACAFAVVPALYEGGDCALRQSLGSAAATLAADTPPLRTAGRELATYIAPSDVRAWADAIARLARDPDLIASHKTRLRQQWISTSWSVAARDARSALESAQADRLKRPETGFQRQSAAPPVIWMDLTLTFLEWPGHITGIIRAELTLAHYLKKLAPETCFFAYVRGAEGYFFRIEDKHLEWLFDANDLASDYDAFHEIWHEREARSEFRNPFKLGGSPDPSHPAYLPVFPDQSIVFFAAIDQDGTGRLHRNKYALEMISTERRVMLSQLIYDLTPILIPQVHNSWTRRSYPPFVEFVSNHFDHLVFGGRTSQRDCRIIQEREGWGTPPSDFLEFGSDLTLLDEPPAVGSEARSRPKPDQTADLKSEDESDKQKLAKLGIVSDFVMSVGTLEPRKNHAMLYEAYLHLLESNRLAAPLQMVFIGKRGWNIDDLLAKIGGDDRVSKQLLIISPTDEELELLYRCCRFTLLPSFYEGWSLTLPESLNAGKFCIAADVDPLREIGLDLVDYIHPLDTFQWVRQIAHYANSPSELAAREARILAEWQPRTWKASAEMLVRILRSAFAKRYPQAQERLEALSGSRG